MREMPAILRRQHQSIYTPPRKRTFKQKQIIRVQVFTRMPRDHQKREAIKIRKLKPEINSREKCAELKDLLF